ncbi:MAG: hypothetical protein ACKO11_03335 [Cuspidothrix sp.]
MGRREEGRVKINTIPDYQLGITDYLIDIGVKITVGTIHELSLEWFQTMDI